MDDGQRNIHLEAPNYHYSENVLFVESLSPILRASESRHIRGVELSNHLLIKRPQTPTTPLKPIAGSDLCTLGTVCKLLVRTLNSNVTNQVINPFLFRNFVSLYV